MSTSFGTIWKIFLAIVRWINFAKHVHKDNVLHTGTKVNILSDPKVTVDLLIHPSENAKFNYPPGDSQSKLN
jgi:hypothetical protein